MIENLDKQQRGWLALALLLIVIVMVFFLVIWPIIEESRSSEAKVEDLSFRLKKYKQIAASKQQILDKHSSLKERQVDNNQVFTRESYALASADLQTMVREAITKSGASITSTQVISENKEGQFSRVGVRVQLSGNINALKEILYKLEQSRPILIVEDLRIRSSKGKYDRKLRKRLETDVLTITVEVFGYLRMGTA